jgi:DNA-binding transcriptional ArsR family regulator
MSTKPPSTADERHPEAEVFAALGDDTRLALFARLSGGEPLSITRLTEGTGVTRQAVTRHLHVLQRAGLVTGARLGREQVWQLERARLEVARRFLDHVSDQWDRRLARLKAKVEANVGD